MIISEEGRDAVLGLERNATEQHNLSPKRSRRCKMSRGKEKSLFSEVSRSLRKGDDDGKFLISFYFLHYEIVIAKISADLSRGNIKMSNISPPSMHFFANKDFPVPCFDTSSPPPPPPPILPVVGMNSSLLPLPLFALFPCNRPTHGIFPPPPGFLGTVPGEESQS